MPSILVKFAVIQRTVGNEFKREMSVTTLKSLVHKGDMPQTLPHKTITLKR